MKLLIETDQTECYDASGREVACAASGQDAARCKYQRSSPRFRLLSHVVRDDWTGLEWGRAPVAETPLDWDSAVHCVQELSLEKKLGRSGWRLPTRRELFSLLSHQAINPALPHGHPFSRISSVYYWTSDSCARLHSEAWCIHLGGGRVCRGIKQRSLMAWPVASSKSLTGAPDLRFVDDGTTVQDCLTGLSWLKKAELVGGAVNWQEAIQSVAAANRRVMPESNDWRLPNIRELESLVDVRAHSPALPEGHPFQDIQAGYWSSTTSVYEPRYAWVLYPRDGAIGVGFKSKPDFFVWPVRDAPIRQAVKSR